MGDLTASLTVGGLPPLRWRPHIGWQCRVVLPAWAGFTAGDDWPPSEDVGVTFDPPDEFTRTPPTAAQVAAFGRLTEGDGRPIRDAVLAAAFNEFLDPQTVDVDIEAVLGEPLTDPAQLARVVAPAGFSVSATDETDGESWLDLELACEWDPGHGIMVLVAGGRVSYFGDR